MLSWLVSSVANLGQLVEWAGVSLLNLVFDAVTAALGVLFAALPHMSDAPELGDPQWLHWANWFFPIGAIVGIATGLVTMYVAFLLLRVALNWLRAT